LPTPGTSSIKTCPRHASVATTKETAYFFPTIILSILPIISRIQLNACSLVSTFIKLTAFIKNKNNNIKVTEKQQDGFLLRRKTTPEKIFDKNY
jgi:hypothetical protein